jgi:hypothetical protein
MCVPQGGPARIPTSPALLHTRQAKPLPNSSVLQSCEQGLVMGCQPSTLPRVCPSTVTVLVTPPELPTEMGKGKAVLTVIITSRGASLPAESVKVRYHDDRGFYADSTLSVAEIIPVEKPTVVTMDLLESAEIGSLEGRRDISPDEVRKSTC